MMSKEGLAKMSIKELSAAIDLHHQDTNALYLEMATRISKQTDSTHSMSDENVDKAIYWNKIAKEHPEILPVNFNFEGFDDASTFFETVVNIKSQREDIDIVLKNPRDIASKDCATLSSKVRRAVKELENDPVFKLISQKEPNPRQFKPKSPPSPPITPSTT